MNTINFFNTKKNFPLSVQVLDFMQSLVKLVSNTAKIGGKGNYILDGCINTQGNIWDSGYVVIKGELLPFVGGTGTVESTVRIREDKIDIIAGYDTYTDALTVRVVEFGSNVGNVDTFAWGDFETITTNSDIVKNFATKAELEAVRLLVMPRGAIIEFDIKNNPNVPTGWRFANGDNVEGYGVLPNKKGRVTVGYDPDAANLPPNVVDQRNADGTVVQNYGAVGNTGGKNEVQLKVDEMPSHSHGIQTQNGNDGADGQYELGGTSAGRKTDNEGGDGFHENRMPYVVGYFIVKIV